jgi:hypothetical protein
MLVLLFKLTEGLPDPGCAPTVLDGLTYNLQWLESVLDYNDSAESPTVLLNFCKNVSRACLMAQAEEYYYYGEGTLVTTTAEGGCIAWPAPTA